MEFENKSGSEEAEEFGVHWCCSLWYKRHEKIDGHELDLRNEGDQWSEWQTLNTTIWKPFSHYTLQQI